MQPSYQADVPDIAISTLADFLLCKIPGLTVIQEWPYGNQQLKYPSLTISSNKPKRMPLMPEIIFQTAPDFNNRIIANEIVAEWDDTFQLDLWCRDKKERKEFTDKVIAAFNSQEMDMSGLQKPDGLSLPMTLHYNEIARYDIDTIQCVDDEAAAQRQERREKITVLVNFREIRQRTYYAMKTIQTEVDVDTNIDG